MSCAAGGGRPTSAEEEADPAQVAIGERLFLETRFSQYFFAHAGGDANAVLAVGDPVMNALDTLAGPIPDPFAGGGINCRNCHLVDDAKDTPGGGNRSYADFTRHSPIPAREDGLTLTPRNSPALVNASLARGRTFVLSEPFRTPASADAPGRTDLGAWNIVRNPDFGDRRLQRGLTRMVCNAQAQPAACRCRVPPLAQRGLPVGAGVRSTKSGRSGGGHRPRSSAREPSKTTKLCAP